MSASAHSNFKKKSKHHNRAARRSRLPRDMRYSPHPSSVIDLTDCFEDGPPAKFAINPNHTPPADVEAFKKEFPEATGYTAPGVLDQLLIDAQTFVGIPLTRWQRFTKWYKGN